MLDTRTAIDDPVLSVPPPQRGAWVAVLFAGTSLLGAALLFMVQPLAAKLILPSYGGSATVWSTSSLFFQTLLLVGYVYTHVATRRLGAWWQPRLHLLVLALPLAFLPVALPADAAPGEASPTLWLLRTLTLMVGVPFLVLSTTGPLVQRWYAWSRGPRADDPYFLFAGSNLGSFVGLLSYPFVIEPTLTLTQQRWLWTSGLCVFLVLMAVCASVVRAPRRATEEVTDHDTSPGPARSLVLLWGALAFLPSCLMLAVTAHLSTDVAPIPLLWVVPLALYLATFIAAFARRSRTAPLAATRAAVVSAVLSGILSLTPATVPIWLVVTVDLLTVTLVSYAAHARLAATRPGTAHLTGFYLVISAGGAVGGLVNGVVAPMFFNRVWEYGLSLACVPLLLVGLLLPAADGWWARRYHPAFRFVVASLGLLALMVGSSLVVVAVARRSTLVVVGVLAVTAALVWLAARTPVVLAVCLLLGTGAVGVQVMTSSLGVERTFYGSYRVVDRGDRHVLVHGTTVHGTQFQDPSRRDTPTGYYARSGPLGDVMAAAPHQRVGVIGLGAGAIAAYGEAGQDFRFFEIDPAVRDIARDPDYFTFLADSAADTDVVVGDGRLRMAEEPEAAYDLVVLDAFSSDAIPVHLLTREAMREYADHLAPGGSLVVHISNRVFDLEPVLAATADDLGWTAVRGLRESDAADDAILSKWVVLTPDPALAARLTRDPDWTALDPRDPVTWTDDYASVLSVLD